MHARAAGLAGMHVCARDGWKMRVASQPILTVPFRKFHTPSTRALHPARAPCGRARTPTTRAVLEFLSNLRGGSIEILNWMVGGSSCTQIYIYVIRLLTLGMDLGYDS